MMISIPMLMNEWAIRSRTEFWMGAIATPLLIQGFFPHLATCWMTVTWTLSCEVMLYIAFPWLLKLPWPRSTGKLLALGIFFWVVGWFRTPSMCCATRTTLAMRRSLQRWTLDQHMKYTPLPYLCTFLAGLTLGQLHTAARLTARNRVILGMVGFVGVWFAAYYLANTMPYVMVHGGLLTPLFAAIILGFRGRVRWRVCFPGSRWWLWAHPRMRFICCTSMCTSCCTSITYWIRCIWRASIPGFPMCW